MCCREVKIANRLANAGLEDLAVEVIAATLPEPTSAELTWAAKFKKPKAVERYYKNCMESKSGKAKGKRAEAYCAAVAWSIYCKHKKPDSPHCRQREYFTGKGAPPA
jgi:hypothetical protein